MLASGYKRRVTELRVFQNALGLLESEIMFASTPLPRAVSELKRGLREPVAGLFGLFGFILKQRAGYTADEAWSMAINETRKFLCLDKEDIDIILDFGKNLGSTDKENQQKNFLRIRYQLDEQLRKAEEKRGRNEKLCKSLGFLLGAALVTLLV